MSEGCLELPERVVSVRDDAAVGFGLVRRVFEGKRMNGFWRSGVVLVGLSWGAVFAMAQQPAGVAPAAGQAQSAAASPAVSARHQVLLDVVVRDKSGRVVSGLQASDFTVLDNAKPTKIIQFHAHNKADVPAGEVDASTEVVLVLDEMNAPYNKVAYAREGIESFLRERGGNLDHPVSLAFFSESGLQVQTQPSIDGNAIADALHKQGQSFRMLDNGTGFYGDEQRLKLSMDALNSLIAQERGKSGRKMVIWISPGWPLLSGLREDLSRKEMQRIFGTVVGLSTALEKARMTLYSVDPLGEEGVGTLRTSFYQNFTKGLRKPEDAQLGNLGLQVLATQTGGNAIFGDDAIATSIDHCIGDLDAYYTVTFEAAPGETPDQFHRVEVRVGAAGWKVRTRDGYYAQP